MVKISRFIRSGMICFLLVVLGPAFLYSQEEKEGCGGEEERLDPMDLLYRCRLSYDKIDDYTATFIKQQRLGGKLGNEEVIEMKFMKPFSVYMKWVKPNKGQEVIYSQGWNKNRIMVHPGTGLGLFNKIIPVVSLEPDHPIAMRGNKYPITKSGLGNTINMIIEQIELARMQGDLHCSYLGTEDLDGTPTHLIMRVLPEKEEYDHYYMLMNIDKERNLPVKIVLYGWNHQLEGVYRYMDLKVNCGLTKEDFDPGNKDYEFGLIKIP